MEAQGNQTSISVIQGDITKQSTDAMVNAANSGLMGGGGVDGAIHRAGGPAILEECKKIIDVQGRLPTGQAVITTGGNLPAKYVIHTVGPIWGGGDRNEDKLLASAYTESLRIAAKQGLTSISFPSISTGAYRYPLEQAAEVAVKAIISFLKEGQASLREVTIVAFDSRTADAYNAALRQNAEGSIT
jgi:O-acetyl-ADP-ribose deacetylase (regulator of RNase III)